MGETIVFTSGKGGVGKTTTIANIGAGLSQLDKKVVMLDADMGLRNLDVVMGMENLINYNLLDLLENKCRINQAIIRDRRYPNLYMIPASLKLRKWEEYEISFQRIIRQLKKEFDYCLIDCPAGMDSGFKFAISGADRAIVVTTPHISSIRDASRIVYLLECNHFSNINLIINDYNERLVKHNDMLSKEDIEEILDMESLGVIPNDKKIIISQNRGVPVVSMHSKSFKQYKSISNKIISLNLLPDDLNYKSAEVLDFFNRKGKTVSYENI